MVARPFRKGQPEKRNGRGGRRYPCRGGVAPPACSGKERGTMWITEFREANGMSLQDFGAIMRHRCRRAKLAGRISDGLIERLETEKGFVTHPHFANLIAEACGATARQRDAIVPEKYRGKWKPGGKIATAGEVKRENPWRALPAVPRPRPPEAEEPGKEHRGGSEKRPVVQLDRNGKVLAQFDSLKDAAKATGLSTSAIAERCMRRLKGNEFRRYGYTFRFRDEGAGE